MRRLVHISDLHFGRTRPELLDPLLASIHDLSPDLVALSGDLTQRARSHQFADARAFLDRLRPPWIAVPGNHDVPLHNVARRALNPYRNYRRWIARDLEPIFMDGELAVIAVNTVDPGAWQRGRVTRSRIAAACARAGERAGRITILMVHHPFTHLPGEPKALMKGAAEGLEALHEAGVDMVLAGHLHAWRVDPVAKRIDGARTLQIQAGTGLSTRQRGEANDFNLITVDGAHVSVERYAADTGEPEFVPVAHRSFRKCGESWLAGAAERN